MRLRVEDRSLDELVLFLKRLEGRVLYLKFLIKEKGGVV